MKILHYLLFSILSFSIYSTEIEVIRGMIASENGIYFNVDSNGCTIKEDFEVTVTKKDEQNIILLQRIRQDFCRGYLPQGVKLFFTYDELGFDEGFFMLANPLMGYVAPTWQ